MSANEQEDLEGSRIEINGGDSDNDFEGNFENMTIENWYDVDGNPCPKFTNSTLEKKFFNEIIDPNNDEIIFADMNKIKNWGKRKHINSEGSGYEGNRIVTLDVETTYDQRFLACLPKHLVNSIL